jgi:hypothetical protein
MKKIFFSAFLFSGVFLCSRLSAQNTLEVSYVPLIFAESFENKMLGTGISRSSPSGVRYGLGAQFWNHRPGSLVRGISQAENEITVSGNMVRNIFSAHVFGEWATGRQKKGRVRAQIGMGLEKATNTIQITAFSGGVRTVFKDYPVKYESRVAFPLHIEYGYCFVIAGKQRLEAYGGLGILVYQSNTMVVAAEIPSAELSGSAKEAYEDVRDHSRKADNLKQLYLGIRYYLDI